MPRTVGCHRYCKGRLRTNGERHGVLHKENFELAGMGAVCQWRASLMQPKLCTQRNVSCERRDVGVGNVKIGRPELSQKVPNFGNLKIFEPGAHFVLIRVTHKIKATRNIEISQITFNILNKVGKHTLD